MSQACRGLWKPEAGVVSSYEGFHITVRGTVKKNSGPVQEQEFKEEYLVSVSLNVFTSVPDSLPWETRISFFQQ